MIHRLANRNDIPFLHALYSDDAVSPFLGFETVTLDEFGGIFDELTTTGRLYVVESDGAPVGAYQTRRHRHRLAHVAYVGSLAVAPSVWGKGIGTRIVSDMIQMLTTKGATRIELLVATDNPRAIVLFRNAGFVVEGKLRNYFRRESTGRYHDEFAMALLLPPLGEMTSTSPGAEVVSIESIDRYSWGADCDGWHLVQSTELSVIQERMPRGTEESRHAHHLSRQFFYVLSGALSIEINGEQQVLGPNEGIEISPNSPHQVRNTSEGETMFLVVSQPPSHGDRF